MALLEVGLAFLEDISLQIKLILSHKRLAGKAKTVYLNNQNSQGWHLEF